MVAAQLILINHFLMTLTKNTVDIPDFTSKNSDGAESGCPYGCTQCSPINGCLACKPPYYLLLLREGPMQTAHCTKACPKGFYRINRKKNGFCSKCTMRGCLECLSGHYCTLCEVGFRHHQGRCYSHNDTDDMSKETYLEREERLLNNMTMSTTPTTNLSVPISSDSLPSTKSIPQLDFSDTTTMSNLLESSTVSTHSTTTNVIVDTVTSLNTAVIENVSFITATENSTSILPTSSSNTTNKSCRKRLKSKGNSKIKGKLIKDVNITYKESNQSNKNNISKEKKGKNRKRQRGRKCGGRQRRRKQKKKKGHSATVNDKFTKTTNLSFNITNNNTIWHNRVTNKKDTSKSLGSNSILLSKHRNDWKSTRIRHYPRHRRLKRLLQKRYLLEEAQKALQQQRAEEDNPHRSASAASIANKIRELRQMTMSERALRKKQKLLCLYQQRHRRRMRKRPDESNYYGPGSIFDGLM